jgi:Phage integrase family
MRRINSFTWADTSGLLTGFDFQRQNRQKAARYQRISVAGCTMTRSSEKQEVTEDNKHPYRPRRSHGRASTKAGGTQGLVRTRLHQLEPCSLTSGRQPWPPDRFTDAYVAFAKCNDAKGIRFHDLRHTHASELLRRGTPVKTVGTRLGHAQTTMTIDTYGHLMDGDDEKAAQTTQDIYGKVGKKKGARRPHKAYICTKFARR